MTNLEWLAKMPREEAEVVLQGFCPYVKSCGSCDECESFNGFQHGCYEYVGNVVSEMVKWLLAEREVHDGK